MQENRKSTPIFETNVAVKNSNDAGKTTTKDHDNAAEAMNGMNGNDNDSKAQIGSHQKSGDDSNNNNKTKKPPTASKRPCTPQEVTRIRHAASQAAIHCMMAVQSAVTYLLFCTRRDLESSDGALRRLALKRENLVKLTIVYWYYVTHQQINKILLMANEMIGENTTSENDQEPL